MLLVQEYLLKHSLTDLNLNHGVSYGISDDYKIILNYSQIESSEHDQLANQCRGLILRKKDRSSFNKELSDVVGETEIVAYPFDRFFNHGMGAAKIDFNNILKVYEKLDGTLIILSYDNFQNKWHTATRAVAEGNVSNGTFTFRKLFELALKESYKLTFDDFTKDLNKNYTYMIELTSYHNRVVVDYKQSNLTLLGVRDNISLKELNIDDVDFKLNKVNYYQFTSIEDIIKLVESFNPIEREGVVLCDSNFNRIKIKNTSYVALHHTIDSINASKRNLLTLILNEKDDDIIFNIAESLAIEIFDLKSKLIGFCKNIDMKFYFIKNKSINDVNHRKEFALLLKKFDVKFQGAYWYLFDNNGKTCLDFIKSKPTYTNSFLDSILENL